MIIPKEIGGKSVRVIDRYAFYQCSNLTSVEFPEGLKKIGVGAFERCNLTSVEFPEGLEEIGNDAFRGCKLKSVKLPESLKIIGDNAFDSQVVIEKKG